MAALIIVLINVVKNSLLLGSVTVHFLASNKARAPPPELPHHAEP
jgi:hypothetical protein